MADYRPSEIYFNDIHLPLPIFFPSISSLKTNLKVLDYINFINAYAPINNKVLISAFDINYNMPNIDSKNILINLKKNGLIILLDSGNYESFWLKSTMKWHDELFYQVANDINYNLIFSYDKLPEGLNNYTHTNNIIKQFIKDRKNINNGYIIPIIHANKEYLPIICKKVAKDTKTKMLAIPERILGADIVERFNTIKKIRSTLNTMNNYIAIHLLGTGSPISIALYTLAGADSFDGLEWCRRVVDYDTGYLHHISLSSFFINSDILSSNMSMHAKVLAHNIEFYNNFMANIHLSLIENNLEYFCKKFFQIEIISKCESLKLWR